MVLESLAWIGAVAVISAIGLVAGSVALAFLAGYVVIAFLAVETNDPAIMPVFILATIVVVAGAARTVSDLFFGGGTRQ